MRQSGRWGVVGVLFLLFGTAAVRAQLDGDVEASQATHAAADQIEASENDAPKTASARFASRIWWNQSKKVEEFGFSVAQRKSMDAALLDYLNDRSSEAKHQVAALTALGQALLKGDQKDARVQKEQIAATTAAPVRSQVEMMIRVVELMTEPQKKILAERYPRLLYGLWVRSSALRGGPPAANQARRKSRR